MLDALYNIVVQPIVMLIELVFGLFHHMTDSPGISIVGVSIIVNLLCLPLYKMADDQQERELAKQRSMERWVSHIKEHFKGDEQYMMLTAYYNEQGYRPMQALVGSLSLLLQIPFFIAAYNYLSHLALLQGASFLFLCDLGAPDGLLSIGGQAVNLLPILMTLLNCASTALYTRGHPLRDKAQAYLLAGLFLFLLYDSPSGLVFYWTCNQLFSLLKNVFMKVLPHPRRWALALAQAVVLLGFGWAMLSGRFATIRTIAMLGACFVVFELFWVRAFSRLRADEASPADGTARQEAPAAPGGKPTAEFFLAAGLLTVLMGLLIPSALIADSPTEFMSIVQPKNPTGSILEGLLVWAGMFVLWVGIYFVLSDARRREVFSLAMVMLAACALIDYFFFGKGMGTLSAMLVFDNPVGFPWPIQLLNLAALAVGGTVLFLVRRHRREVLRPALAIALIATAALCVPNILAINDSYDAVQVTARNMAEDFFETDGSLRKVFPLSKSRRNVVVLFLDRAISLQFPYILQERPELKETFDGFTYYPNTISFGGHTNYGAPPIYGGYEYTPQAMNARPDELLKDKHNEALKLMPTLFSRAGYETVVVDAPYANYEFVPDLSIYDGMEGVEAYNMAGAYSHLMDERYGVRTYMAGPMDYCRYSLLKVLPDALKAYYYTGGTYMIPYGSTAPAGPAQIAEYATLDVLPDISTADKGAARFLLIANGLPHEPWPLQLPDYKLSPTINNDGLEDMSRFTLDGVTMDMDKYWESLACYHVNMASYLLVGEWLDWMRAEGVYDNTRIIIVADHGFGLEQFPELTKDGEFDVERVNPMLLVKDFDAHGFHTSDEFMTNADVPTLAMEGIISDPVNPFTGEPVDMDEKTAHDQMVTMSHNWGVDVNNGTTFDTSGSPWYSVHDDIFDMDNWQKVE